MSSRESHFGQSRDQDIGHLANLVQRQRSSLPNSSPPTVGLMCTSAAVLSRGRCISAIYESLVPAAGSGKSRISWALARNKAHKCNPSRCCPRNMLHCCSSIPWHPPLGHQMPLTSCPLSLRRHQHPSHPLLHHLFRERHLQLHPEGRLRQKC